LAARGSGAARRTGPYGEAGQNGLGNAAFMAGGAGGGTFGYHGGKQQFIEPQGTADGNGGQTGSGGGAGGGLGGVGGFMCLRH